MDIHIDTRTLTHGCIQTHRHSHKHAHKHTHTDFVDKSGFKKPCRLKMPQVKCIPCELMYTLWDPCEHLVAYFMCVYIIATGNLHFQ